MSDAKVESVLNSILVNCNDLDSVLSEFDNDADLFDEDVAFHSACIFILMQIGENVKRIETYLVEHSPDVDWRSVCRFRDLVAHNYGKIIASYV